MRFKHKKAIVTGANRSMGRDMAVQLAKEGADVVISYRSDESGASETVKLIEAAGAKGACFYADFSDMTSADEFAEKVIAFLGGVDILINNAGMLARQRFFEIDKELAAKVMQVNVLSPFRLTQVCAEHMIANNIRGSVVNISSIAAESISVRSGIYSTSKAALNTITKTSAIALAEHGIRVNAVSPGVIEAGMNETTAQTDPALWQEYCQSIALGRTGKPSDITQAVLFLLSDAADWVTGKILTVDGGHVF